MCALLRSRLQTRIETLRAANAEIKLNTSSQMLALQHDRMQWEMAKCLLGPESNASVEERSQLSTLLCIRLIESLSRPHAVETLPNATRHPSDSASALATTILRSQMRL